MDGAVAAHPEAEHAVKRGAKILGRVLFILASIAVLLVPRVAAAEEMSNSIVEIGQQVTRVSGSLKVTAQRATQAVGCSGARRRSHRHRCRLGVHRQVCRDARSERDDAGCRDLDAE